MKSPGVRNAFSTVILIAALALGYLFYNAWTMKVPRQRRLADCDQQRVLFELQVPAGRTFSLVLGIPTSAKISDDSLVTFAGNISIEGQELPIMRFDFRSEDSRPCNWLKYDSGLNGYIINGLDLDLQHKLNAYLQSGRKQTVTISFSNLPPSGSSIWLAWYESRSDRAKRNR